MTFENYELVVAARNLRINARDTDANGRHDRSERTAGRYDTAEDNDRGVV